MSDLREAIAKALFERILGPWVWEGANKRFSADYLAYADVVIAVITTHMNTLRPSKDRFLSAYDEGRRDAIHDVLDVLERNSNG